MAEIKHPTFGVGNTKQEVPEQTEPARLAEDDLKSLIELGCLREEFLVGEKKFVIKTLNASERLQVSKKEIGDLSELDLLGIQCEILSLAIESIDGRALEDFHPNKTMDPFERRKEILAHMQSPVIMELLAKFTELTNKADGQFSVEAVKN